MSTTTINSPDDPSLWTLARYTEEVEEVRRALGLEHYVLYGHSWGCILAIEYALNYRQHLRGLMISNMTAGIRSYLKRTWSIKKQLPPETLARLTALEAKEDYDSPEYQRIMMEELYPRDSAPYHSSPVCPTSRRVHFWSVSLRVGGATTTSG